MEKTMGLDSLEECAPKCDRENQDRWWCEIKPS